MKLFIVPFIKGCNILEEEHTAFQKLIDQEKSEQEALQILRLTSKPKTGPENYQWLQELWTENQWSTFADFLQWYKDLDVTPMLQAIENMNDFYKNIRTDFIHQAISLPGVAMRVCFNSITDPTAEFHLFNSKNKEIYQLFKENIVGGPALFLIDTMKLVKLSFEITLINPVRRLLDMMQMHFGPLDKIFLLVIH